MASPLHNDILSLRRRDMMTSPSTSMSRPPLQVDEGYSEETRSQTDSEMLNSHQDLDPHTAQLLAMVLALPEEQRKRFAEHIIHSLPNGEKEYLGEYCQNLTHFDPSQRLPNELMLSILSFLDPKDLLTAASVSRAWRERAHDEKLWRGCFAREGWVLDRAKMNDFEQKAKVAAGKNTAEGRKQAMLSLERRGSRKRKTEEAFSDAEGTAGAADGTVLGTVPLHGQTDVDMQGNTSDSSVSDSGEDMEWTGTPATAPPTSAPAETAQVPAGTMAPTDALMNFPSRRSSTDSASVINELYTSQYPADIKISPTLWRTGSQAGADPKLSWQHLYKQRSRLERNWEKGIYKTFSLPHPRYRTEGHEECVYTIQHTNKHLVSGSRDKTIRIWRLDTSRLVNKLEGHQASVLCLQFDERPEHDIIVSGGSDSWVIIWRFSTGEILKRMTDAHAESVLNLRFDDRYIVTCSKDKTIKVWNRRALTKEDKDTPAHILPTFDDLAGGNTFLPEYSLLNTLIGHQAAVNAVMIHDNIIISASGDRTIKSWNINAGRLNKTYVGHTKGIACVQFDGRRIVSGSSDNTVRIFDAENMAEIACLAGHLALVRTVQARFGDLDIVTDEELEDESRRADRNFYKALQAGMFPARPARTVGRNAGSSRPEDMLSVGTKVPPGGGGSRWAKIVSGSYDEVIRVWKRDSEGNWTTIRELRQDDVLNPQGHASRRSAPAAAANNANNAAVAAGHQGLQGVPPAPAIANASMQQGQGGPPANIAAAPAVTLHHAQHHQHVHHHAHNHATAPAVAQPNAVQQNPQAGAHAAPPQQAGGAQPAAAAAAHHHHHHGHAVRADSNRVFKLQFDARRVICCSQNKTIVGWDFAAGDRELERVGGWSVETA